MYTKDPPPPDKIRILSSTGSFLPDSLSTTKRSKERVKEDLNYVPVIIKRHDESKIHPDDILERAIHEGLEQLKRPALSLFLSSTAAGLILGFTAMTVAIIASATQGLNPLLVRIAMAVGYPLGFIICITSGTQLFTEHTATAVYPVLDKKHEVLGLVRLWVIVIAGNLVGTGLSASLIAFSDSVIQAHEGYLIVAHHLVDIGVASLLLSAILAGWLMAQGAWMLLASSHQISQMFCIFLVTFTIGLGGLHHSIAGSAEIFIASILSPQFTIVDCLRFISIALVGNLIGGSLFVATLNYAHIRSTQDKRTD